jgi:large subunit ribosomal protein L21
MYAVVTSGGKQYRVEAGDEVTVERLSADAGSSVTFDRVLFVADGETITVGTPTVEGATVTGTVVGDALGPKLRIFKFKQKVKYRRTAGHRQRLTRVRIDEIAADGRSSRATATEPAPSEAEAKPRRARRSAAPKAKASVGEGPAEGEAKPKPRRRATAPKAATASASDEGSGEDEAKPRRTRRRATPKAEAEE